MQYYLLNDVALYTGRIMANKGDLVTLIDEDMSELNEDKRVVIVQKRKGNGFATLKMNISKLPVQEKK